MTGLPEITAQTLIYAADREFIEIVYGYFTYPHVVRAIHSCEVVRVLVGFTGSEKQQLDQGSGKAFARVFGFWSFLFKKFPFI